MASTVNDDSMGEASPIKAKETRFDPVVETRAVDPKDGKTKDSDYYFSFYASLQNQANMIGDVARTGTYRKAILGNAEVAFKDKLVLDVGAGSGILSFMSAQAGAKHVVALEASSMADKMAIMVDQANRGGANPHLKDKIRLVRGMVENSKVQDEVLRTGKVDTIISEPIGVMLLHERMVESFLLARDLFLKPDGQLLPSGGSIFFSPFTDEALHNETEQKALFFNQDLFGTDFRALYPEARTEVFAQPVVGMFPPTSLLAGPSTPKVFDFYEAQIEDLHEFTIEVDFVVQRTALVHGLASWFDLAFTPHPIASTPASTAAELEAWSFPVGTSVPTWPWMQTDNPLNPPAPPPAPQGGLDVLLSTGPNVPRTHWQQARLLLPEPLAANKGERLVGSMQFKVNEARSYDITLDICIDRPGPDYDPNPLRRHAEYNLSQQCFNYSYNPEAGPAAIPYGA